MEEESDIARTREREGERDSAHLCKMHFLLMKMFGYYSTIMAHNHHIQLYTQIEKGVSFEVDKNKATFVDTWMAPSF